MFRDFARAPLALLCAVVLTLTVGCPSEPGPVDSDGDGYLDDEDCNDTDAAVHPGAEEVCDDQDNDCNGVVDDLATDAVHWYRDTDGDGYGDPDEIVLACEQPDGFEADDTDCDDTNAGTHPGADETCNGVDDDCDDDVDEDPLDPTTYHADFDLDGYGDPDASMTACTPPAGYVEDDTDCDDVDAGVHPGATEACNGSDDDCDGEVPTDEADGDGDGYRLCDGDCDDAEAAVNPGALEICNAIDDDCDGTIDLGADDATHWYLDSDGDGYGAPTVPIVACSQPSGFVDDNTDCDDTLATGGTCHDTCIDFYGDNDGDGYGDPATIAVACSEPLGYVAENTDCDPTSGAHWHDCGLCVDADGDDYGVDCDLGPDCDDGDVYVYPGAEEICDGKDSDCDGFHSELGVDPAGTLDATTIMGAQASYTGQAWVCVLPGTYHEDVDWTLDGVRLMSTWGPAVTTIEGSGNGPVLSLTSWLEPTTIIDGFTIRGGDGTGVFTGGGVHIENSEPTLRNLIVTSNTGQSGGGICLYANSGSRIIDTVVELNTSADRGGGIYIGAGSYPILQGVTITDNFAVSDGGGVYIEGPVYALDFEWVTVVDNETDGVGGGMAIFGDGSFDNVVVSGNRTDLSADHYGGGIYVGDGDPVFNQLRVTDNETSSGGGGIHVSNDVEFAPEPELYGAIIAGNHAVAGNGAGMQLVDGVAPLLINVSFVGNWAEEVGGVGGYGGAIFASDFASPDFFNVDFSDNLADVDGGGVLIRDATTAPQHEYNNAWDNTPNAFADLSGTMADPFAVGNPDGNITEDPAYLWTGGPDAADWDLHLNSGSPLIDAGDTSLYDPDISRSDIGAYGGFAADLWDLDHDGYPEWWQPGAYDGVTYPGLGLDCDDMDPTVYPGNGC